MERLLGAAWVKPLAGGRALRLISAWETLEARREAEALAADGTEQALCSNACLVARALYRGGRRVFDSGRDALEGMSAGQIETLARQWTEFDWAVNPAATDGEARVSRLKKAWSTRLMSAFSGVCSRLLARFRRRRGPGR